VVLQANAKNLARGKRDQNEKCRHRSASVSWSTLKGGGNKELQRALLYLASVSAMASAMLVAGFLGAGFGASTGSGMLNVLGKNGT
jgi:hypothetical protein